MRRSIPPAPYVSTQYTESRIPLIANIAALTLFSHRSNYFSLTFCKYNLSALPLPHNHLKKSFMPTDHKFTKRSLRNYISASWYPCTDAVDWANETGPYASVVDMVMALPNGRDKSLYDSWRVWLAFATSNPAILSALIAEGSFICTVADNKYTSPSDLELLSHSDRSLVRECVARNPSTPFSVLQVLARDEVSSVRCTAQRVLDIRFLGHKIEKPAI